MVWSLSFFRDTGVPVLVLDPSGLVSSANPAAQELLGRHALSGLEIAELVVPADRDVLTEFLSTVGSLRAGESFTLEPVGLRCRSGERLAQLIGSRGVGEGGIPVLYVSPQVVPSEPPGVRMLERRDPLTGLASRSHGLRVLDHQARRGATGCLLLVDIDDFEDLNLALGVVRGDEILVEVADRVQRAAPGGSTVARVDGDAFLVVSPGTPVARGADLARTVLSAVAAPMDVAGTRVVTASIGVAGLAGSGADEALTRVGRALEAAKAQGGRQAVVDGPVPRRFGRRRSDLIATMRAMESSIEALRADAEHAHAEARTDALTGLPNLRRFAEDVGLLQDRVRRAGTAAAVLFLDLDEFGLVNRVFGQERGDRTLAAVAAVLSAECRAGDEVYRVGGEEFIVLLPGSDLEGGRQVAERMRGAVEVARIPHGGRSGMPIVTVSIGVAAVSGHAADMSQAITGANEGERRAKEAGRNRVFPPGPPVGAA